MGTPDFQEIDMGAREFLDKGGLLRLDGGVGAGIRVHDGAVWLTQYRDPRDHLLRRGAAMDISHEGVAIVTASEPTLLEVYRMDPTGVRRDLQRRAEADRSRQLFRAICGLFGLR
jgi:hypothetical protein